MGGACAARREQPPLGSALYAYAQLFEGKKRSPMIHAYLGPSFTDDEIEACLRRNDVAWIDSL